MKALIIDAHNMMHRARVGLTEGEHSIVYNFFRGLRALVEQHRPNRVYFVMEGVPTGNLSALPTYKANRAAEEGTERHATMQDFHRQKRLIVDLLSRHFPLSVVRHPTFEADDTIANIVSRGSASIEWTVASTDTDFIQLLQSHPSVRLYNPVKKSYVEAPPGYDYVTWKALRGDSCDNIPGLPGVGDKTATKIASDPSLLEEFLSRPEVEPIFARNYGLIRFAEWTDEERMQMTSSAPTKRSWSC
ncbi:MAG: hypothetical protein EBT03_11800 [Betaproteobacteria bacterium]|nr:hypothetical protein [Betaproteobacteria bacterium]